MFGARTVQKGQDFGYLFSSFGGQIFWQKFRHVWSFNGAKRSRFRRPVQLRRHAWNCENLVLWNWGHGSTAASLPQNSHGSVFGLLSSIIAIPTCKGVRKSGYFTKKLATERLKEPRSNERERSDKILAQVFRVNVKPVCEDLGCWASVFTKNSSLKMNIVSNKENVTEKSFKMSTYDR